jgi:hypothetical protein
MKRTRRYRAVLLAGYSGIDHLFDMVDPGRTYASARAAMVGFERSKARATKAHGPHAWPSARVVIV